MKNKLIFFILSISFCVFFNSCNNYENIEDKPNIIFIMADDLGYNELGCYGQEIIKTPSIDRIAGEGMKFTQFYSGSPVCAPSRGVLLTGFHTGHSYIRNNYEVKGGDGFLGQMPLADSVVTIAEILQNEGYATAAIGKWGLGRVNSQGDPNNQGFDLFFGYNCQRHAHNHYPRYLIKNQDTIKYNGNDRKLSGETYSQDEFIREALKFINDNKDNPFFLYLPFAVPHLSIQVPEKSLEMYKTFIKEEEYEHHGYLEHPFPRAGYAAMITHMDKGIGQILHLLGELSLEKNTVIFFTSDNGPTFNRLGGSDSEYFKSAGVLRGLKGSVYEGGIRVPMIVRWPGKIKEGKINEEILAFQDILPTLADLGGAGNKIPDKTDGINFTNILLDKGTTVQHEYLYMEFPSYGGQQMVRMGNWKGVRKDILKGNMSIELYNLEKDISEQNDVSDKNPKIINSIREIMNKEHVPSDIFSFELIDTLTEH